MPSLASSGSRAQSLNLSETASSSENAGIKAVFRIDRELGLMQDLVTSKVVMSCLITS